MAQIKVYSAFKKNLSGWRSFACGSKARRLTVTEEAIIVQSPRGKMHANFILIDKVKSLNYSLQWENTIQADHASRARSASAGVGKIVVAYKDGPDFVLTMDADEAKAFVEDVSSRFRPTTRPITPPPSPPCVTTAVALPPVLVGTVKPAMEEVSELPPAPPAVLPVFPLTEPHHTLVQGGEEGQSFTGLIFIASILAFIQACLTVFTGDDTFGSIRQAFAVFYSILNAPFTLHQALLSLMPAPTAGRWVSVAALLFPLREHRSVFYIVGGMGLSAITSFLIHALAEKTEDRRPLSAWLRPLASPVAGLAAFLHASCLITLQILAYPGPQLVKLGLTLVLLTLVLKQWSFVVTSAQFRLKALSKEQPSLSSSSSSSSSSSYPTGITWSSYIYSLFAPTLIFQPSYPRAASINWPRVLGLVVQQLMILMVSGVLVNEWIQPLLDLHKHAIATQNVPEIALATLRLSVPSTLIWLMMIGYGFFHVHLNLVAEVTRFGDRLFFKSWWNARTLRCYWSTWNLPVSSFLRRHVLHVLKRAGSPVNLSMLVVFFVSALLHEVVVAVPLGTHRGYRGFCGVYGPFAFLGMLAQMAAILMTDSFKHRPQWMGNVVFWFQFCVVGQPLAVLLYHHEVTVYLPQLAAGAARMA